MTRSTATKRGVGWTLIATALALLATERLLGPEAIAQQSTNPTSNQGRQLTLREQLVTGLRAFTKADFDFIDEIVILVDQGKLPRRLVNSTFLWSRDRAARRSFYRRLRPMVFFRPAMIARAKRLGLSL